MAIVLGQIQHITFNFFLYLILVVWQRRSRHPYGAAGGGPGALGRNTWIKKCREEDGDLPPDIGEQERLLLLKEEEEENRSHTRTINIGGKATILMGKGDRLVIETPGGGAWGALDGTPGDAEGGWKPEWSARGSVKERETVQAEF